ncbi:MAG: hypothetical protein AAFQ51_10585 [Pseudomonadota bacterium]
MKRRYFMQASALAGATGALAAPAVAQGRRRLRVLNAWSGEAAGRGEVADLLATRVAALSGAGLTLTTIDRGASDRGQILRALQAGDIDGVVGAEELWSSLHPAFGLFTSTPGGMMERELEAWIRSNTGQAEWDRLAAGFGLKSLYLGDSGAEYMWSRAPIAAAADVSGLAVDSQGLAAEVYRALGARVTTPAPGAVSANADIVELGPLAHQYQTAPRGMTLFYGNTPTRPSSALSLTLNKAVWDGMSSTEQRQVDAAATAITHLVNGASMQRNALAFQALGLRSGLTVTALGDEAWSGLMRAAKPVFEGIEDRDAEGKRVIRAYRQFASAVQNWTMVADAAFTNARARSVRVGG